MLQPYEQHRLASATTNIFTIDFNGYASAVSPYYTSYSTSEA